MEVSVESVQGEWSGGYWRRDARGRKVYIIRRQVAGHRHHVSTRATTERGALAQLARFDADPANFKPGGDPGPAPVFMTTELVTDFLAFSRDVRKNSAPYRREQKRVLAVFADAGLRSVNLRAASLRDDILPALSKFKDGRSREAAKTILKSFFSWMRGEQHLISPAEDPTYGGTLRVAQGRPAQLDKSKVIPRENYLLAREHLIGAHRDGLDVLAATGWHVAALIRFAEGGCIDAYPKHGAAAGVVGVLVTPHEKNGHPHRTALMNADVLAAGKRLLECGKLERGEFFAAIRRACAAATIPRFGPGQFRHSVATWAIDAGADPAAVAAFLGHRSFRTTLQFYATNSTPKPVPTLVDVSTKP